MCGIAGILSSKSTPEKLITLKKMQHALHHRGPDDQGIWHDDFIHFSHNRLSIIDLTQHGHQPMLSYDERFIITYNGEIYNYLELKELCLSLGSQFNSLSDTEVIMECYRHFGKDSFVKFKGMWAFVLYDRLTKEIVFSRDPFGIKPLYYGVYQGDIYFASEPKALRVAHDYFSEPDETSIQLFTESAYLDRGDWTFFKNIKRFPHACYATLPIKRSYDEIQAIQYWYPRVTQESISYSDAVDKLRTLLIDSISLHLRSDVPVGACLSGGIDSSAIVSIGNKIHNQNFQTFTIWYDQHTEINEREWAEKVIRHTQANSHFVEPTYNGFMNDLESLVLTQDEPFGSTSIYAQYVIFKKIAAENIKVILDGQGSDEQFSGYLGFIPIYLSSLLDNSHYLRFAKEQWALNKNYKTSLSKQAIYHHLIKRLKKQNVNRPEQINITELADTYESRLQYLSYQPQSYEKVLIQLLTDSNIPQLLRYEDRNSMAFSVESRVPFLEPDLVNFVLSLPANFKIRSGYTKAILRDAIKGIVPDDVRLRINKLGFPTPELEWMKQGFGLDVKTTSSKPWRELITQKWRSLNTLE